MRRALTLSIFGAALLSVCPAYASPVDGHYREAHLHEQKRSRLEAGDHYVFKDIFVANQRACVIVEGDHLPVTNLKIEVFDRDSKLVAMDSGGDFVAAIWYPIRTQEYRVSITSDGEEFNALDIVVK